MILSVEKLSTTTLPAATIILFASSTPYRIVDLCPIKQLSPILILPKTFEHSLSILQILLSCVMNFTSPEMVTLFPISTRYGSVVIRLQHIVHSSPILMPDFRKYSHIDSFSFFESFDFTFAMKYPISFTEQSPYRLIMLRIFNIVFFRSQKSGFGRCKNCQAILKTFEPITRLQKYIS